MALVNHTALGVTVLAAVDAMKRKGFDPEPVLSQYDFDLDALAVPMARVSLEKEVAFFEDVNDYVGDPSFHMYTAASAPLGTYHLADYFTMFAPTVGMGYGTTLRNVHIINSSLKSELEQQDDHMVISLFQADGEPCTKLMSETVFAAFALRTHWLASTDCLPTTLRLRQLPGGDKQELEELLKCHIEVWDGPCDQLLVPMMTWDSASSYANPTMHAIINKLVIKNAGRHNKAKAMLMRVEAAIMTTLKQGAGLEAVSNVLFMSSRTLQRRLTQLGVQFRRVVLTTRHRLAIEMMQDSSVGLLEVASRAGYTDASAFGRAFRKITGYSPRDFRALDEEAQRDVASNLRVDVKDVESWDE